MENLILILLMIVFFEFLIQGNIKNNKISLMLLYSIIIKMVAIIIIVFIQIF